MASAQKTDFLSLNKWISTDIPKREDFNYDNTTIDTAFKNHLGDSINHISAAERTKWNTPYFIGFYTGDGKSTRTITTGCPFEPNMAIVFAGGSMPIADFGTSMQRVRFGFASKRAASLGLALSGANLSVSSPDVNDAAIELNRIGGTYGFILFR